MLKVLLVNPKQYPARTVVLGLAYVAGTLEKEGHEVKVYDPAPYEKKEFASEVKSFRPDVVGITCTTPESAHAKKLAKEAKEACPGTVVIVGGPHPTTAPEHMLAEPYIDVAVMGEGERTAVELLGAIEKNRPLDGILGIAYKKKTSINGKANEKMMINPRRPLTEDLDELALPARHLFPMDYYSQRSTSIRGLWLRTLTMMSTRGCPNNCIYCASKTIFGQRCRFRNPKKVVDEMEHLLKDYELEGLVLNDDTFTIRKDFIFSVCDEIRDRGLDFKWQIQSRVNTLAEDVVRKLKEAGVVQIGFGVESGSPKVLKALNKGTTPQQARDSFALCRKHGIRTVANFMIGNPEETLEDIQMTSDLAKDLDADYTDFYITTPYPGTKLYDMALENGWIDKGKDLSTLMHGVGAYTDEVQRMQINFSSEELERMRDELKKSVLKKKFLYFLRQPRYVADMSLITLTHPWLVPRMMLKFLKTGSAESSLRLLEEAQQKRRFLS